MLHIYLIALLILSVTVIILLICKCKKDQFENNCNCNIINDNLKTDIWGPSTWHMIHSIAFAYPDKPTDIEKQDMLAFFNILTKILPCRKM